MSDAEHGLFDMVVVKDISRFARNTVDLLQNVRKLKIIGNRNAVLNRKYDQHGKQRVRTNHLWSSGTGRKCQYFQACKIRQEDECRKRTSSEYCIWI